MRALVGACIAVIVVAGTAWVTVVAVGEAGDVGWVISILTAGAFARLGVHVFGMLSDRIEAKADREYWERFVRRLDAKHPKHGGD